MLIACSEEAEVHGRHAALPALPPKKLSVSLHLGAGDQLNAADAGGRRRRRIAAGAPDPASLPEHRRADPAEEGLRGKTREKHRRTDTKRNHAPRDEPAPQVLVRPRVPPVQGEEAQGLLR